MKDFPKILDHRGIATINGNFYVKRERVVNKASQSHAWYKMELYLPAATGTFSEPLMATAQRFIDDIAEGRKPFKFAITNSGNYNHTDYTNCISKWFDL